MGDALDCMSFMKPKERDPGVGVGVGCGVRQANWVGLGNETVLKEMGPAKGKLCLSSQLSGTERISVCTLARF
jgi:hypothetical protein